MPRVLYSGEQLAKHKPSHITPLLLSPEKNRLTWLQFLKKHIMQIYGLGGRGVW